MRSLSLESYSALVDAIYEAGHDPGKWTEFLSMISDSYGGVWASLHCSDTATGLYFAVAGGLYDPRFIDSLRDHYGVINPWLEAVQRMPVGKAQTSESLLEPSALRKTQFYNEWIRPQEDIGTGAGITVARDRHRLLRLSCNIRFKDQENIQADLAALLDLLSPHLKRCFSLTRHLRGQHLGSQVAFDALPSAIFLLNARGRVLYANKAGEILRGEDRLIGYDAAGRLVLREPGADDTLRRALHDIAARDHTAPAEPILLRDRHSHRIVPVTVAPLTSKTDELSRMIDWLDDDTPIAIVCLDRSGDGARIDRNALARTYGLTPAETDLALALHRGASLKTHAVQRGVSYHTTRAHLRSVFRKTGTARQSQLVALLAGNGRNRDPGGPASNGPFRH